MSKTMVRSSRILGILIVASLLVTAALAACGSGSAEPTQAPSTAPTAAVAPAAGGAALLDERCSACHSADVPKQGKMSRDDWDTTVSSMIGRGAKLSDAEKAVLVDYLAQTYGP